MIINYTCSKQFRLGQGTTWYVLAGEYDRTKTEGTEKMIGISRIFIHERFKEFDNDIGEFIAVQVTKLFQLFAKKFAVDKSKSEESFN